MTVGEYIEALVLALRDDNPAAFRRLREVVGVQRARITLDTETVVTSFDGNTLLLLPGDTPAEGEGTTDSGTVLDLLDGHIETFDAILSGRIEVRGSEDGIDRILVAIDILLETSVQSPRMRRIAAQFRDERGGAAHRRPAPGPVNWYPFTLEADMFAMLARLDLLG